MWRVASARGASRPFLPLREQSTEDLARPSTQPRMGFVAIEALMPGLDDRNAGQV
jgi:hypothetical protein